MKKFKLHSRLSHDLLFITSLKLSDVFLMPDSDNPWVVLVPRVADITELHLLSIEDQQNLLVEINVLSQVLSDEFKPDKLNIATLGNMVPQLHIHIICRFINDKAWPGAIFASQKGDDKKLISEFIAVINRSLVK
ncbi:MAG: HIT domain-containing protein [Halobacteriovoraceae bacterium]|jgi:diadenosine tetraphosphate (Ap4A) HIT family hydrolase|nr:HIT domain-containing protein [Halobacteriovoraceae bacterium]